MTARIIGDAPRLAGDNLIGATGKSAGRLADHNPEGAEKLTDLVLELYT
jgi:hypothetical protein